MKGAYQAIIFLVQSIQVARSLICLSCASAITSTDCAYVETCGSLSECYIDLFASPSGELRYSLGCRDTRHCPATKRRRQRHIGHKNNYTLPLRSSYKLSNGGIKHVLIHGSTEVASPKASEEHNDIAKRRRDNQLLCSQCCNHGNLCNNKGCTNSGYVTDHGPICYNCAQQTSTSSCDQIKECGRDEMCYIEEITVSDVTLYHTKCMGQVLCRDQKIVMSTPSVPTPVIIGRNVPHLHNTSTAVSTAHRRYTRATQGCCGHSLCNTYLPQNGNWGPWMSWSGCTASCGFNGYQKRTRNCEFPPQDHGGLPCEGNGVEVDITCANKPCNQGMICLSCSSSIYPRTCNYIETCGPNSVCYLERYVTRNGDTRYKSGCRDINQCSNGISHGKRFLDNGDILSCTECCHGNLCNSHGCHTHHHPSYSGPTCYSCDQQVDSQHCNKIDVCKKGQMCGLKKLPFIDVIYQTMCLDPVQCLSKSADDDIYPKCCTSSLCGFSIKDINNTTCVPPAITSIEESGSIVEQAIITLTCHISGTPSPNVTWMVFKDREDAVAVDDNMIYVGPLDQHMLGAYKCVAHNNCGTVEQNFTISHIGTH